MADYKGYGAASMKAGKDLSLYQFAIVTDVAAQKNFVQAASASANWPIGILQNKPNASGKAAEIAITGVCRIKLGAKMTSGSPVVANASGFGASLSGTGSNTAGRLLYGGSIGDVVPILLQANPPYGAAGISVAF